MSVKHFWMKNENGPAAFLCGAVSVVCDYFNAALLENDIFHYVSADVFFIGDDNEVSFENAMRSRFVSYMQNIYLDDPKGYMEKIKNFSLDLKKSRSRIEKLLSSSFLGCDVSASEISDLCASLCHFFSQIRAIYVPCMEDIKQNALIKEYYAQNVRDIIFVEFDRYLLVLIVGVEDQRL